jgi:hypothetical protein
LLAEKRAKKGLNLYAAHGQKDGNSEKLRKKAKKPENISFSGNLIKRESRKNKNLRDLSFILGF